MGTCVSSDGATWLYADRATHTPDGLGTAPEYLFAASTASGVIPSTDGRKAIAAARRDPLGGFIVAGQRPDSCMSSGTGSQQDNGLTAERSLFGWYAAPDTSYLYICIPKVGSYRLTC